MKLAELQHAGRAPLLPLVVELPDGNLRLLSLLRVLPGQRYVGEAEWRGQRVLAKIFVGAKAQRHHARECEGARWLHDHATKARTRRKSFSYGCRVRSKDWR